MSSFASTWQTCEDRDREAFTSRASELIWRRGARTTRRQIAPVRRSSSSCKSAETLTPHARAVDTRGQATEAAMAARELQSKLTALGTAILFLLITFLGYENVSLKERINSSEARVSDIATRLIEQRQQALSRDELGSIQSHVEDLLDSALRRVSMLEDRSTATARVIGSALPSVVFLQGAYRFEDEETGRLLRYVLGPDGEPVMTLAGPAMSIKGDGPAVERQFTGTAFVATEDRVLITNRHLVRPWEGDDAVKVLTSRGLAPVMYRLVGYLPGNAEHIEVELLGMSDEADVAILKSDDLPPEVPHLELSSPVSGPGEPVIVMGYPTGIQALLARADHRFVDELREAQDVDFWTVARELSNRQHISPLASLGIVGQVTESYVVYDAETAQGGSGGPVLGLDGRVLAINSAVIPGFNGSNLGVPIEQALRLLDRLADKS